MRPFAARGGAFARASKRGARSVAPKAPAPRKKRRARRLESLQGDGKESPKGQPSGARRPWRPGRPRRFDPSHPFIPIHYIEDIWLLSEPGAEIRNNVAYRRRNRPIGAIFARAEQPARPRPRLRVNARNWRRRRQGANQTPTGELRQKTGRTKTKPNQDGGAKEWQGKQRRENDGKKNEMRRK